MTGQRTYAGSEPGMFEELFHVSGVGMAVLEGETLRICRANAAFGSMLGGEPARLEDDVAAALRRPAHGISGGTPELRRTTADGRILVLRITAVPLPGGEGRLACFVEDISRERRAATDAEALRMEAQHRIRNCLAVLRSIFLRTVHHSNSPDDLAAHFLGRFDTFCRIQSNVVLHDQHGLELNALVLDELAFQRAGTDARLHIGGPELRLRAKPAETISLAVHELAANSVKFGVLGSGQGSIAVEWEVACGQAGDVLLFSWTEESDVEMPAQAPAYCGSRATTCSRISAAATRLGGSRRCCSARACRNCW